MTSMTKEEALTFLANLETASVQQEDEFTVEEFRAIKTKGDGTKLSKTTVQTILSRHVKDGIVTRRRSGNYYFYKVVKKEEEKCSTVS